MRTILLLPLAALAAGCANEPVELSAAESVVMNAAYGAELDEAIGDRTAGRPVACVRLQDLRNSRAVGANTILFDGPGGTVYVNRTRSTCPRIESWHAISHRTTQTAMCSGELIRVFDPQTGIEFGGCSLGEFTPYRRRS